MSYFDYIVVLDEMDRNWADPLSKDYMLNVPPLYVMFFLMMYALFAREVGPKIMTNYAPYNLKWTMTAYNVIQIICCGALWVESIRQSHSVGYNLICQPLDTEVNEVTNYNTKLFHFYYLLKLADLLDTVFFVLRKKESQITFLHLYHHAGMVALTWGGFRYFPSGHLVFIGLINLPVHCIMYTYYLLTIHGYKPMAFKKFVTQIQMIQFGILFAHTLLVLAPSCTYPKWIVGIVAPQQAFMFVMFLDFYLKTYGSKKEKEI